MIFYYRESVCCDSLLKLLNGTERAAIHILANKGSTANQELKQPSTDHYMASITIVYVPSIIMFTDYNHKSQIQYPPDYDYKLHK